MLTITFLFKSFIDLYIMIFLLQIWMQWANCDFYNQFLQFILKITKPIINPLRNIITCIGQLDSASLILAFILAMIKFPILTLIEMRIFIFDPIYLLIGLLTLLKAAGDLVFWVIIIRSLLSWVSHGKSPMDVIFYQLSEPLMSPIRRMLPVVGGIDFSAMIVIMILYAINYLGMDIFPGIWYRL